MPSKQPNVNKSPARPYFRPRSFGEKWGLVASLLALTVCYWLYHGGHRGQLIEIDRASPLEAKFLVDINRADWPEILQLPGLGETLAQRVLAEREQNGPYRDIDELTRVDGIGPKTLEKIRPYLLPIPQARDWADVGFDGGRRLQ